MFQFDILPSRFFPAALDGVSDIRNFGPFAQNYGDAVIRPVLLYGSECWSTKEIDVSESVD